MQRFIASSGQLRILTSTGYSGVNNNGDDDDGDDDDDDYFPRANRVEGELNFLHSIKSFAIGNFSRLAMSTEDF